MHKSLWITTVAVTVAFSGAQAWAQSAKPAKMPMAKTTPERMKALTLAEGVFHCKGPGGGNNYVKCTDIPVIVLLKTTGGCIVHVPYSELVVHSKRTETPVTWYLIAPDKYKFDQSNGVDLTDPGNTFNRGMPNPQLTKYSWKVVANSLPASTDHKISVRDPDGIPCEQGDPTITNDPS